MNPFWWVDLGKKYQVKAVKITNRRNGYGYRLRNLVVKVGGRLCATFGGRAKTGQIITLPCIRYREGRKVTVTLKGKGILSLAEVAVYGIGVKPGGLVKPKGINVAFRRITGQSSNYNKKHSASKAVDGNINTFTHTKRQRNPFWWVYLGRKYIVKTVKITNRRNGFGNRLHNPIVKVDGRFCATFRGRAKTGQVITLRCKPHRKGQKVTVMLRGSGILSMAEVAVYGSRVKSGGKVTPKVKPRRKVKPKGINVALRRKAGQSSNYKKRYSASKAVDGNINTFTHTKRQRNPFWWVDLGKKYIVKAVKITNRRNGFGNRLHNPVVKVDGRFCATFRGRAKTGQLITLRCRPHRKGRHVKVMLRGSGILSMAEVAVYGNRVKPVRKVKPKVKPRRKVKPKVKPRKKVKPKGNNVALRQRAGQSSNYNNTFLALKAVDGNVNTYTHTKKQRNPYWWVDLGRKYLVKAVTITNRRDGYGYRLRNVIVKVDGKLCASFPRRAKTGQVIRLNCQRYLKGRRVTVMLKGNEFLSLAEVSVNAIPVKSRTRARSRVKSRKRARPRVKSRTRARPRVKSRTRARPRVNSRTGARTRVKHRRRFKTKVKPRPIRVKSKVKPRPIRVISRGNNVALRKRAGQSSNYNNQFLASKAVDGNVNTFTHTKKQRNPYWWVDLGKEYMIKAVTLTNRRDGYGYRLRNVIVKVDGRLCASFPRRAKTGQVIRLNCQRYQKGRRVTVMLRGNEILSLAEVSVNANPVTPRTRIKPRVKSRTRARPIVMHRRRFKPRVNQRTRFKPRVKSRARAKGIVMHRRRFKPRVKPRPIRVISRGNNVALRKRTGQSSNYNNKFLALKAVDGNVNTFTQTKKQRNPYWWVDLGKEYMVKAVTLANRRDGYGYRLRNVIIKVDGKLCASFPGRARTGQVIRLRCKRYQKGHRVTVMLRANEILSLAEVSVDANPVNTRNQFKARGKRGLN